MKPMPKRVELKLLYALSFAAQLGFLIVAPLAGFIWIGVVLDRLLVSSPTFILTGLFIGLAVTGYETYRLLEPLLEKDKHDSQKK